MIIYRIFFGFCEICLCFLYICLWFQSVLCSPPWPPLLSASFRHAHRYYFKFFCTQENSFPFPFVLKWCVFIPLPFTSFSLGRGRAVHSAVHTIHKITLSFFLLRLGLSWKSGGVFCVLLSAHTLQRQLCSRRVSLSVRSHPPHYVLGGALFRQNPDGTTGEMKASAHWGAFWDTFLKWKSSLKTWLTQSSNLNSHDAVLDLFNFCIVLYVRFRYFLEFTFAILGFLLLDLKTRELLGTNGEKRVTDIQCFEWVSLQLGCIRSVLSCLHLLQ